jgi:hypothetical protein
MRHLSFALLGFLFLACASDNSSSGSSQVVVTDTLGWTFNVTCESGPCTLSPRDTDLVPKSCVEGSGTNVFLLIPDPLLAIYAVLVPSSGQVQLSAAEPSHPVACASDADCVPSGITVGLVTRNYACTNGLCQCTSANCATEDGNPLTYDVLTLCQAEIPWPTMCPYITSQPYANRIAEVATACGSKDTCATVPADCRQLSAATGVDAGT